MVSEISIDKTAAGMGIRLRKARVEAGLTQALLAARAGISVRVISRMERGDMSVGLGRWLKVSLVLGLLESWDPVLLVPEDPFAHYDKEQRRRTDPGKRRVRPRKQP
ncbi:MAG: helix-turn-helix domain-containing protein [Desulfobulbaceae bacterium]|nr:helix-turn-helix domain-containing protein [Desulfobulbaceae bacterium]